MSCRHSLAKPWPWTEQTHFTGKATADNSHALKTWFHLQTQRRCPRAFPRAEDHQYRTCASFLLEDGESVSVDSWVLVRRSVEGEEATPAIGRVIEMWQVQGSQNHLSGLVDGVLLEWWSLEENSTIPSLPRLRLPNPRALGLVRFQVCRNAPLSNGMHA